MTSFKQLGRRAFIGGGAGTALAAATQFGGSTASNYIIRSYGTVTVTERGASLAGLRAAAREVELHGGGVIRLAVPLIDVASNELAATGSIQLSSSTKIEGEGAALRLHGDAVAPPLFSGVDVSNITLRNLTCTGNRRAVSDSRSGAFIFIGMSSIAKNDIEDFQIENVELAGFSGERWVQFLQQNSSGRKMSGISVIDLSANGGSSLKPSSISVSASPLWIHGADGEISDVEVRQLRVDAEHLKQGVVLFHKVRKALISHASVSDAGMKGAANDAGAYAILAYADHGEMTDITIDAPAIRNPRSAGIYLRGVQDARVINPMITGQIDTVTTNLPKGAIALNGCSNVTISGGILSGNAFDLSVADGGLNTLALQVRGLASKDSKTAVILAISPGQGRISGVRFLNCDLSAKERVFRVMNEQVSGRHYDDVWLLGGSYSSETAANVIELTQEKFTKATGYRIEDVTVRSNNVGIMAAGLQGTLRIRRATVEGLGRLTYGIIADDCPQLDWKDVTFRNMPTGYAYVARSVRGSAKGSLAGLRFVGVSQATAQNSLQSHS